MQPQAGGDVKVANDSVNAVIGRQVDFALAITSVALPLIDNGKLLALAVTAPQRHARMPKVATLAGWGIRVTLTSIGGLSVPAGTPAPIVKRLSETLHRVLARPDVKARLDALGGRVMPSTPDEYTAALRDEIATTEKLMAAARLEAQWDGGGTGSDIHAAFLRRRVFVSVMTADLPATPAQPAAAPAIEAITATRQAQDAAREPRCHRSCDGYPWRLKAGGPAAGPRRCEQGATALPG